MINFVSLDMNGTLIDDTDLINEFWFKLLPKEVARIKNLSFDEAVEFCKREYEEHYEKYGRDKNWISPRYWFKKFGVNKTIGEVLSGASSKVNLYDDSIEVIDQLSKKYKIIIATNHPKEFIEFGLSLIDKNKIFKIYSSNDMGLSKKDEEFWRFIVKDLKVNPNEIIHVGDRYSHDYIAPMKVGINVLYLKREKVSLLELIKIAGLV